jgi:hypothetical protein
MRRMTRRAGESFFVMSEKNNQEIAKVMTDGLQKNVK